MQKKIKKTAKIAIVLSVVLTLVALYNVIPLARAAELSSKKVTITDSRPSQTGVDYVFTATHTASNAKCIQVDFCTTATSTCTGPTGFTTVGGDKGDAGDWNGWTYASWTYASVDANTAKLTFATGENGGSAYKFVMGALTNSSVAGTYYARIHTYSNVDCATGEVDSGNVAFANVSGVSVSATVAETLTFTIDDSAIGFGEMGTTNIRYATADEVGVDSVEPGNGEPSTLTLSTNAQGGAVITIEDVGSGAAAGLYNTAAAKLIAATAPSAVAGGTESYAPYTKNVGTSLSAAAGFLSGGGTAVLTTPATFITASGPLSSNNTADIAAKAGITATSEAGTYSDTLILIATPTY